MPPLTMRMRPGWSQTKSRPLPSPAWVMVVGEWICFSTTGLRWTEGKAAPAGDKTNPVSPAERKKYLRWKRKGDMGWECGWKA